MVALVPDVGIALAMGVLQVGAGLVLYSLGSKAVPAGELALLSMTEVLLGPIWVWLFLGETASLSKEVEAAERMVERTEECFDLKPKRLAGDVAYGTGESLDGFITPGIEPHIPIKDMSQRRDGTFSRDQFSYEARRDVYVCPGSKILKTTGRVFAGNTLYYRASKRDCDHCSLKAECCPSSPQRRVPRDVHEGARDHARALMETQPFLESRRARKKIETRFGDLKWNLGLTRLRLRGLSGARDEFLIAATVQNLRRLATLAAMPPPEPIAAPSHV